MSVDSRAVQEIRERAPTAAPRVAVVLGSGWSSVTERIDGALRIPYADLTGFPVATVAGHSGELWLGRIGSCDVAVMSGRRHVYESGDVQGMKEPLATLHGLGCRVLVQTNAAGSMHSAMAPGSLMLISDHINLSQRSPLVGDSGSERFVDMKNAYDDGLRALASSVAASSGVTLHEGVYAWNVGPQFETPAEIRMFRLLGADAVGMSTVPETIPGAPPRHARAGHLDAHQHGGRPVDGSAQPRPHVVAGAGRQRRREPPTGRRDLGDRPMTAAAPDLRAKARTALACLDLTSLNDADSDADIDRLCARAVGPFGAVAAVCVWPRFVDRARRALPAGVRVAAVANFPAGSTDIAATLRDVGEILAQGGDEIDVVLPYAALRSGDDAAAARLLAAVRTACAGRVLKVILETGELVDESWIARAALIALDAGADFLKTSTGKTAVSATLPAARTMLEAIASHPRAVSHVGFKVSGGLRTVADAAGYIALCKTVLGPAALQPSRFRIGASSLLNDIETVLGGSSSNPPAAPGTY